MYLDYLAPELLLGLAGLYFLLTKVMSRDGRRPPRFSTLVALLALVLAGATLWTLRRENASFLGGTFVLDPVAIFFKGLFLVTALLTVLGAGGWARRNPEVDLDFHALLLFETAALMLMVSAGELISLYLALEASVVTFFALTGLVPGRSASLEATLKYVLVAGVSAALLLYGMSFLYGFTGTTNLEEIGLRLDATAWAPLVLLTGLLLLAGFGFKLAVVPFHFWAPDVYEAAPTPVVTFLAVASKAAAVAVTVRVFTTAFSPLVPLWTLAFTVVSAATVIFGNLAALPQTNVKRLLAYSSVAQSGYLLLGLAALSRAGLTATFMYTALYTISNLTAFLVLQAWEDVSGSTDLAAFGGLAHRAPFLAAAMLIALLSLGGIPPLAGFIGKFTLFVAVIEAGRLSLVLIAVTMSIISVYYYLNVARVMYVEEASPGAASEVRVAPTTLLAIGLSLAGTILLGVYPVWVLQAADWAARMFWGWG